MRLLAFALILAATGASAENLPLVAAPTAAAFAHQVEAMGYKVEDLDTASKVPSFSATIGGHPTTFLLGGCTDGANCRHLILVSSFSDVVDPPAEWMNEVNTRYDLAGVYRNDRRQLAVQHGVVLGADGIPATTFRAVLEEWQNALSDIAEDAIKADIVTK